jgi:ankyrin repeat protein
MRTHMGLPPAGGSPHAAAPTPPNSPECHEAITCDHLGKRAVLAGERNNELAAACRMGLARVVRESLKRGADPSHVDRNGRTPVFEAAYHGHVEALSILCDSSADTGVGWTAAHTGLAYTAREIALLRGNSDVVQVSGLSYLDGGANKFESPKPAQNINLFQSLAAAYAKQHTVHTDP